VHATRVFDGGFARIASKLGAPLRANEVADDSREPRTQRAVRCRSALRRDYPRVLRDVVGDRIVTNQRTREAPNPGHLGHELLAGGTAIHLHRTATVRANVRENRIELRALARIASSGAKA
jgi:hypothetical protein